MGHFFCHRKGGNLEMIEEYNLLQILEPLFEILFLPFLFWDNSGMILGQSWDNYNQIIPSL